MKASLLAHLVTKTSIAGCEDMKVDFTRTLCIGKERKGMAMAPRAEVECALKILKGLITAMRRGVRFGRINVIFTTPEDAAEHALHNLESVQFIFKPEYMGLRPIKVTFLNLPDVIPTLNVVAFLGQFGKVVDISSTEDQTNEVYLQYPRSIISRTR